MYIQTILIENQQFLKINAEQCIAEIVRSFNLVKFLIAKYEKQTNISCQIKIYQSFMYEQNQLCVISRTQKIKTAFFLISYKRNSSSTDIQIQFFQLTSCNNKITKQEILKEYKHINAKEKNCLVAIAKFFLKQELSSDKKNKRQIITVLIQERIKNFLTQFCNLLCLNQQKKIINLPSKMTSNYIIKQEQNIFTLPFSLSVLQQKIQPYQKTRKHIECVIRPFERMLTHNQYQGQINRHLKNYRSLIQKQRHVQTHFICHFGNCFLAFLLSVSHLLRPQKLNLYVKAYIDIKFKFQTLSQSKDQRQSQSNKKSNTQLKKEEFKIIAKNIKFLIHNLLLQYEKQIVSLSAQLSFIFEIVQLINESLISFQFTNKCIQLLQLYGRRFPQILLKSQKWIKSCSSTNQEGKIIMSLLKMLQPGIISNSKQKFLNLIEQISHQIDPNHEYKNFTFKKQFQISGNYLTFVGVDITSKKTRFFNSSTTPDMNFSEFLIFTEYFQSIHFRKLYEPYYVNYQNSCEVTNLFGNSVVPLIGVNTLQQFIDNTQLRKRYFSFYSKKGLSQKSHRIILQGQPFSLNNIYDDRLRAFRQKRRQIISDLKQIVIDSIPKTKLIWKFIRYSPSKQKNETEQERKEYFQVLKRVEVFNYCFDFYRAIKNHDRNLNKQIWKPYTIQTQVTQLYYNYAMVGQQNQKLEWQKNYAEKIQKVIEEQTKQKKQNESYRADFAKSKILALLQKALNNLLFYETQSELEIFHIKKVLFNESQLTVKKIIYNPKLVVCSELKQLVLRVELATNEINICQNKKEIITILKKILTEVQYFKQNLESKECFLQLKKLEKKQLLEQIQTMRTVKINFLKYFDSQSLINSHKLKIIKLINDSIAINKEVIKKRLYFDLGLKEIYYYDQIAQYADSYRLQIRKMVQNSTQNGNKINVFAESTQYSEYYCSFYIKILFEQICKKQGSSNTIDIKLALSKIQSLTCTNYHTILVLNIFLTEYKNLQSFNQIIQKLTLLKNLFLLQNNQKVQNNFGTFKWHLIDQSNIQNFYKQAYSYQYIQFLKKQNLKSATYQQILQTIKNQTRNPNKTKQCELFIKRKQIQIYLGYEVLEELIQSKIKKRNIQLKDIISKKIQYNNTLLEQYSALQKKEIIMLLNKFMTQLQNILNLLITTSLQNHPPVYNIWKSVLLKQSISILTVRDYVIQMLNQYGFNENTTFLELNQKINWKGTFNIMLWNLRRKCVQICNHLTKPHMPIIIALVSACSQPFYTCQQYSHHRWQKPINQNSLFTTFHQFSQTKYRNSLIRTSLPQVQFKKTQSNIICQQSSNAALIRQNKNQRGNRLSKVVKSTQMSNLLDQKVNSYLCPNSLSFYPLLFLTNPCLTPLQVQPDKSIGQRKWICFSFDEVKQNFFQRFKRPQTGNETKLTFGQIFNLYLNKKDNHVNTLRIYLKKFIRQTHYYLMAKTFQQGTANLYKYYLKVSIDSDQTIEQLMQQSSSDVSSYTSEGSNDRDINFDDLNENYQSIQNQKFINDHLIKVRGRNASVNLQNGKTIILEQDVYQVDKWGDLVQVSKRTKMSNKQLQRQKQYQKQKFFEKNIKHKDKDKKNQKNKLTQQDYHQESEKNLRSQNDDNKKNSIELRQQQQNFIMIQEEQVKKQKPSFIYRLCCCLKSEKTKSQNKQQKGKK